MVKIRLGCARNHDFSRSGSRISQYGDRRARLYRLVRPQAKYARSLEQIKRTKEYGKRTKSGIMLGLGETKEEVIKPWMTYWPMVTMY